MPINHVTVYSDLIYKNLDDTVSSKNQYIIKIRSKI